MVINLSMDKYKIVLFLRPRESLIRTDDSVYVVTHPCLKNSGHLSFTKDYDLSMTQADFH